MAFNGKLVLLSGNFPPEKGGPSKFVDDYSSWLEDKIHSVTIISTHPNESKIFKRNNADIILISRSKNLFLRYIQTSITIVKQNKNRTIFLANGMLIEVLIASLFSKINYIIKLPGDIVWEQALERGYSKLGMLEFQTKKLNLKYYLFRKTVSWALHRARSIYVPSTILYKVCLNWGIAPSNLKIIPNSVNTNLFFPNQNDDRVFDVITVSRLISIKQIDQLIQTCARLKLKLNVVGEGPALDYLMKVNESTGGLAHFHGPATQIELPSLYRQAKVFALNSSFEAGTPYALLEARACGLPTIANENTGSEDVIKHGFDGFLCGERTGISLEFALDAALRMAETGEFNANSLFQETIRNYSTDKIYQILLESLNPND
jgi:glycosyltransferase involved in cell wall biosynthesis